jgi:hypothetical protein
MLKDDEERETRIGEQLCDSRAQHGRSLSAATRPRCPVPTILSRLCTHHLPQPRDSTCCVCAAARLHASQMPTAPAAPAIVGGCWPLMHADSTCCARAACTQPCTAPAAERLRSCCAQAVTKLRSCCAEPCARPLLVVLYLGGRRLCKPPQRAGPRGHMGPGLPAGGRTRTLMGYWRVIPPLTPLVAGRGDAGCGPRLLRSVCPAWGGWVCYSLTYAVRPYRWGADEGQQARNRET